MAAFSWPSYPSSEPDFEALMKAIDQSLSLEGYAPPARPLLVGRKFSEAFGWGGSIFPPRELAEEPGYSGLVLMAKAQRWYEQCYGNQLKIAPGFGSVPVRLGNALWRMRTIGIYGQVELFASRDLMNDGVRLASATVNASHNVLRSIDDLPQGLANRLTDVELSQLLAFFLLAQDTLSWFHGVQEANKLFPVAQADFEQCTEDILARRYPQACAAAQLAAEKVVKGFLGCGGTKYPTGGKLGHDLLHLGELLRKRHEIGISEELLKNASCPSGVRYANEPASEERAQKANHAVLVILCQLKVNPKTASLLNTRTQNEAKA